MTNAFETYADEAKPVWRRKREQASAKRAATVAAKSAAQEKLEEDDALLKAYRASKRAELDAVLAGPYGHEIKGLRSFLRTMTLSSAPALIAFVERAAWIREASEDIRHIVLGLVGRGIMLLRLREGYEPFDDALWDEPAAAFHAVKAIVMGARA